MDYQQGSGSEKAPLHSHPPAQTFQPALSDIDDRQVVEHAAKILGLSFDVLLSFSTMLQNQQSIFRPPTEIAPCVFSKTQKTIIQLAADLLKMPSDALIALSSLVQPQPSAPRSNVVTSEGTQSVTKHLNLRTPTKDPRPTAIGINLDKASLTINPALLTERAMSSETTSSNVIITPRSTNSQSSVLQSTRHIDHVPEHLTGLCSTIPYEYLALGGNAEIPNITDTDWDWSGFGDILQNPSPQAEPWVGVELSDSSQVQDGYSNMLNFDLQSDFLRETVEGNFPVANYMTSDNEQAMENDISTPQLFPATDYSISNEDLQNMHSFCQQPNPNAHSDHIQFGDRQRATPTRPSQQIHSIFEGDLILSDAHPGFPKSKKLARRTKATTSLSSRATAPARVEKPIYRDKKSRRVFDLDERAATACTREAGSCVRCKMQKSRCVQNPLNPDGPCTRCLSDSAIINIPCLRKKIPDARFTPAKDCPEPYWTTRWTTMDVKEIDVWASSEVKTILLTQDVGSVKDVLRVRMIIPLPGDSLTRTWMSKATGERFYHQTAPWAIMNMTETAQELSLNIDNHIEDFINHFVDQNDKILADTYRMAFRLSTSSKVEEERFLLRNVLRLWVAARRGTKPQRVIGEEKLGILPQTIDRDRHDYGEVPVPPVISAQLSLLREALIVRPWTQEVRLQLETLVAKKKPESWLIVYLVMFILLHNCSLLTAYFMKKAKNLRLHAKYHAIAVLEELHFSVSILLTYYHYVNKGGLCFATGHASPRDIQRLKLDDDQLSFLISSAKEVKRLESSMKKVREENLFHHEYYFVSQLYDLNWILPKHTIASVQ